MRCGTIEFIYGIMIVLLYPALKNIISMLRLNFDLLTVIILLIITIALFVFGVIVYSKCINTKKYTLSKAICYGMLRICCGIIISVVILYAGSVLKPPVGYYPDFLCYIPFTRFEYKWIWSSIKMLCAGEAAGIAVIAVGYKKAIHNNIKKCDNTK